ncbi:MOSC domain-containing protein YiiM [Frigoribacterium sp. PhB107]|uniref:MOSC domain-containing protein n=1 Tax=Frigoribacterium sp. PhB107 TaxID=2485172 RepID=UPI000F48D703|nr:MOSC domain-containing protein [Frigoribacterium sp. PhB107]ROP75565.1 MOSC domain-containing protein YiiM [Frigoribacterium sp. PhB107]
MTAASVVSVSRDPEHRFSKEVVDDIVLIAGLGVDGDAHAGTTVQHRSRVARDPSQPNLRQVHLVHAELFDEVEGSGFEVAPGELGENVTTRGVDLLGLPRGAVLRLGPDAVVEVTGLRNPCVQIDGLEAGLMRELVTRDDEGQVVRKAGVMAVVLVGGRVAPGDRVGVELPEGEHEALQPV